MGQSALQVQHRVMRHDGVMASDADKALFSQLCDALAGSASSEAEAEVGAGFDKRLEHARVLVQAGEGVLGIEDLASNLYEFEIPLSAEQASVIEQLATTWGVERDRWSFIQAQVR